MTYDLYIGDRTFSSWSLRGWLMFSKFGLPVRTHLVGLYTGTMAQDLAHLTPARLVPAMRTPDGVVVGETQAMAETLAEAHPEAGLWPSDPKARALARWLVAEMHAGFGSLREHCPMNLANAWDGFEPNASTLADITRIQDLWQIARNEHGQTGPWLFGDYSLADVFYAPVAARIAGYGLQVNAQAQAYVAMHLADPAFNEWRDAGLAVTYEPFPYDLPYKRVPWPKN